MAVIEEARSESRLGEEMARLRHLIESGRVDDARGLVAELAAAWPNDTLIQKMVRVLAPPTVLASGAPPDRPHRLEREWLKEHAREHPGCWIAVYENRLIAANSSLAEVLATVRNTIGDADAVLFFEPGRAA